MGSRIAYYNDWADDDPNAVYLGVGEMNWSNEWDVINPATGAVQIGYGDDQVAITLKSGDFIGTLVGDLVVYSGWGKWRVAHYPTMTRFDKAVPSKLKCVNGHDRCFSSPDPDCQYCEKVVPTREQLLDWCDRVQCKHGELWAILRELTPDNFDANDSRTIKTKDQLREWCLSVEV